MGVLRRIFGPKRYELIGGWGKLHVRTIKSGRMIWAGYVACIGEKSAYRVLVGKHEGKRPL
jgi:hypothetical protein